jgi:hypothetical protein
VPRWIHCSGQCDYGQERYGGGDRHSVCRLMPCNCDSSRRRNGQSVRWGFRGKTKSIPGRTRKAFRGEGEQDSGLNANRDSGGKANSFRWVPESFSRWPGMLFKDTMWRRSTGPCRRFAPRRPAESSSHAVCGRLMRRECGTWPRAAATEIRNHPGGISPSAIPLHTIQTDDIACNCRMPVFRCVESYGQVRGAILA